MKRVSLITRIFLFIGFFALLILTVFLLQNRTENSNVVSSGDNGTPGQTPRIPGDEERKQEIENYKTKIADTALPSDTKELLEKRLAFAEKRATLMARPANPNPKDIVETADPTFSKGFEEADGIVVVPVPYSPMNYRIKNVWKGKIDQDKVLVYAGAITNDKDQGIVIIRYIKNNESYFFLSPSKSGILTITGYEGSILRLSSEQDDVFYFDVANGVYLEK
jgi:hypothetical protein